MTLAEIEKEVKKLEITTKLNARNIMVEIQKKLPKDVAKEIKEMAFDFEYNLTNLMHRAILEAKREAYSEALQEIENKTIRIN